MDIPRPLLWMIAAVHAGLMIRMTMLLTDAGSLLSGLISGIALTVVGAALFIISSVVVSVLLKSSHRLRITMQLLVALAIIGMGAMHVLMGDDSEAVMWSIVSYPYGSALACAAVIALAAALSFGVRLRDRQTHVQD